MPDEVTLRSPTAIHHFHFQHVVGLCLYCRSIVYMVSHERHSNATHANALCAQQRKPIQTQFTYSRYSPATVTLVYVV